MTAIWLWLVNSKFGRAVGAVVSGLVVVALVLWRVFAAGKKSEKAAQERSSAENLRKRSETHEEVVSKPAARRRRDLAEWVPDDE